MRLTDTRAQLRAYAVLTLACRKLSDSQFGTTSRPDACASLFDLAERAADRQGLWRRTDIPSILNLLLMYQLSSLRSFRSLSTVQYLRVAVSNYIDHVNASFLAEPAVEDTMLGYCLLVCRSLGTSTADRLQQIADVCHALDRREAPFMCPALCSLAAR
jgi:hypothetical protein